MAQASSLRADTHFQLTCRVSDWFGNTHFQHPQRHNTHYQPHAKLCTFPHKFGAQVHHNTCRILPESLNSLPPFRYIKSCCCIRNGTYCPSHLPELSLPLPARCASQSSPMAPSSSYRWLTV